MIKFRREGKAVRIEIHPKIVNNEFVHLDYNCNDEWYAVLLLNHLEERMKIELTAIRKQSYFEGWRDAKAKRAKQTWWKGWFE